MLVQEHKHQSHKQWLWKSKLEIPKPIVQKLNDRPLEEKAQAPNTWAMLKVNDRTAEAQAKKLKL